MICGKCWRRGPKRTRERYSYWRRKGNALEKKGDPRAPTCFIRAEACFHQILDALKGADLEEEGMPALMAEELRKLALL